MPIDGVEMAGLSAAKQGALWGMLAADALAMPVHWYYNPYDIKSGYGGWLTGYKPPNDKHPSSILNVSATDGSGRASGAAAKKPVIGNVILHDKLKYWTSNNNRTHYHHGMAAGDNTLNAITTLHLIKTMQRVDPNHGMEPRELRSEVMEAYVTFMTTPDTHNDIYAESFHRMFFRDWVNLDNPPRDGASIVKFAEERYTMLAKKREDAQIPVIGAFVMAVPWILHYADKSVEECSQNVVDAVKLTHPAPSLMPYVTLYTHLLHAVLHGADLREQVWKAAKSNVCKSAHQLEEYLQEVEELSQKAVSPSQDLEFCQDAVGTLGMACYIDGAMKSMMFLAFKFDQQFENGVLMNANCGGENCHRGAALGALLGAYTAASGRTIPEKLISGLNSGSQLAGQIADKPI